jgi:hypothetical protein
MGISTGSKYRFGPGGGMADLSELSDQRSNSTFDRGRGGRMRDEGSHSTHSTSSHSTSSGWKTTEIGSSSGSDEKDEWGAPEGGKPQAGGISWNLAGSFETARGVCTGRPRASKKWYILYHFPWSEVCSSRDCGTDGCLASLGFGPVWDCGLYIPFDGLRVWRREF